MSPHQTSTRRRQSFPIFQVAILFSLLALCGLGIVSSTAQSPQDGAAAPAQAEREFKNTVPGHVPIKVKIRNEKSFKDIKNKGWSRELEFEVKNTGDKPIYFIFMILEMSDVIVGGYPYALQVTYGRKELVRLYTPLQSDDVPIQPGETVALSVSQDQVDGYEHSRDKEKRAEPKKVKLELQVINFGDGTGLRGTDGRPYLPH